MADRWPVTVLSFKNHLYPTCYTSGQNFVPSIMRTIRVLAINTTVH